MQAILDARVPFKMRHHAWFIMHMVLPAERKLHKIALINQIRAIAVIQKMVVMIFGGTHLLYEGLDQDTRPFYKYVYFTALLACSKSQESLVLPQICLNCPTTDQDGHFLIFTFCGKSDMLSNLKIAPKEKIKIDKFQIFHSINIQCSFS